MKDLMPERRASLQMSERVKIAYAIATGFLGTLIAFLFLNAVMREIVRGAAQ